MDSKCAAILAAALFLILCSGFSATSAAEVLVPPLSGTLDLSVPTGTITFSTSTGDGSGTGPWSSFRFDTACDPGPPHYDCTWSFSGAVSSTMFLVAPTGETFTAGGELHYRGHGEYYNDGFAWGIDVVESDLFSFKGYWSDGLFAEGGYSGSTEYACGWIICWGSLPGDLNGSISTYTPELGSFLLFGPSLLGCAVLLRRNLHF